MNQTKTTIKPLRADARRNRELVLDAAQRCFGRDGMQTQMDEIATCAGVGVGTVYRHFPTKDALVEALAASFFAELAEHARAMLAVEDPWEAFGEYMRGAAEMLAQNRALAQLATEHPEVMKGAATAEPGFFELLDALIDRARESGSLREDFRRTDIPAVMCAIGSLQISRGEYADWRRLLELVLDGVRAV